MSYELIDGLLKGLMPTPIMTVTEWADSNRFLSSESSAEPGRWRTDRTPYLERVGDDMGPNSPVIEQYVCKGVQLGFTEHALNIVGVYMDICPCPIMYVMPTIDMAKSLSKIRLAPMIANCPTLSEKIKSNRERDSGNTILEKTGPGFMLSLAGANSPAGLSSKPVRILIMDEVDRYPLSAGEEGSPHLIAIGRTSTFGDKKKIYMPSTPTLEKISVIWKQFLLTDQQYYFVPCPDCGHMQTFKFDNLKWVGNDASTVYYSCEACEHQIKERYKTWMMKKGNGEWRATVPENARPDRVGRHLSSLYSPIGWLSWQSIVDKWLDAQGDVLKLRTFYNTILGLPWKDDGECPPWENIYNRREDYEKNAPSKEVVFITVGVDVQKDRLELEVVGWCRRRITQSIDYRVLIGDTTKPEVWSMLRAVVGESWTRSDGVILPMRLMAVDAGYNTQHVYNFCKGFDVTRVIPVKGQDSLQVVISSPKQVDVTHIGKKVGAVKVWHVGVSLLKSELYGNLRQEISEEGVIPDGYCRFPEYDHAHFKGLTAEQLEYKKNKKGFNTYQWVKIYERNEQIDCRNYARAAASVLGMDRFSTEHWDQMDALNTGPVSQPKRKPRSDYWDR